MAISAGQKTVQRMLPAAGILLALAVATGCSTLNTEDAVDGPGAVQETSAASENSDQAASPSRITINSDVDSSLNVMVYQAGISQNDAEAIAWTVEAIRPANNQVITVPPGFAVQARDGYGNITDPINTSTGQRWSVQEDSSGIALVADGTASAGSIVVLNNLNAGAETVEILRDGKVLASSSIAPKSTATFTPSTSYHIALAPSGVRQGDVINSAVMDSDDGVTVSLESGQNVAVAITSGPNGGPVFSVTGQPN